MTKLDVVTGFLGAGKTTFLCRYISWLKRTGTSFCVIENEFGAAGVDGALLEEQGAQVREISGGCVCCTLKVSLHDLLKEYAGRVDRVLLEPSGLFCGDDLWDILNSPDCRIEPGMWTGILDPMTIGAMAEDELAVLRSELESAGSVILSKVQYAGAAELKQAEDFLEKAFTLAPAIWAEDWDRLEDNTWFPALQEAGAVVRPHVRRQFDHTSMFQSACIRPSLRYQEERLREMLERLMGGDAGEALRAKGFLLADRGSWFVNCTPAGVALHHTDSAAAPMLNVIGRRLRRRDIARLLSGELCAVPDQMVQ